METIIRRIMADILGLDPSTICEGTSMDNTTSWDSLAHINLMTSLEQELGIVFEIEEIEQMRSFGKIVAVVHAKQ